MLSKAYQKNERVILFILFILDTCIAHYTRVSSKRYVIVSGSVQFPSLYNLSWKDVRSIETSLNYTDFFSESIPLPMHSVFFHSYWTLKVSAQVCRP
jgi:hypothetical protein